MRSDLHLHSTASDGTLPPAKVMERVFGAGIQFAALTDHDNVDGIQEAVKRGKELGVTVIRGIELSTYDDSGELHILGYGMRLDENFRRGLKTAVNMRLRRNKMILDKLLEVGVKIDAGELYIGKGIKGRLHIARLIVKKGYCESLNEAFDKYIGKGGSAYVTAERYTPRDGIELIANSGGIPVLAHPSRFRESEDFEIRFRELVDWGLKGIEAYYPSHTPLDRLEYANLAKKYGLITTGGSDFHSDTNGSKVGQGEAELNQETVQKLIEINKGI